MLPKWIVSPDSDGNFNVRRSPKKGHGTDPAVGRTVYEVAP